MEDKFIEIFTGLDRDYGYADVSSSYTDSKTGKLKLKYGWAGRSLTRQDYLDHLEGRKSIGIQPCNDDGMARFGAIDIDSSSYEKFDYRKYLEIIDKEKLPIVPVKSKSGGLHLYVFFDEEVSASYVRGFLDKLLFTLGLKSDTEIFPKQTELGSGPDNKPVNGNFINLPYYNKSERVALNLDGKEFTFEQFIQVVEANKKTKDELDNFINEHLRKVLGNGGEEFSEGPVCLQAITKNLNAENKLDDHRDRFLYNYMVFAKKVYPDNWGSKVLEGARKWITYDNEWGDEKVKQKVKAWSKETAGHICTEEPIVNYCVKSECAKRRFGYLSDKTKKFPKLSALIKIDYQPDPEFRFTVHYSDKNDGEKTKMVVAKTIDYLMDMEKCRRLIAAHTPIAPPRIKQDEFQNILDELKQSEKVENPPAGTSPQEILHKHIFDYVHGVQAVSDTSFREGSVLKEEGEAFFVYHHFYDYLKNREWKHKIDKTGRWMQEWFFAEHQVQKRFPKKSTEKTSHNPVRCTKISLNKFKKEAKKTEVLDIKGVNDIL